MCKSIVLEDTSLCHECWGKIKFISEPFCKKCGYPLEYAGNCCAKCITANDIFFDSVKSIFVYDNFSGQLIIKFKHGDQLHFAPLFARLMMNASAELLPTIDAIIPVPIHWIRLLKRRHNQSAVISMYLSKMSKIEFYTSTLIRHKATKPQKSSAAFRQLNVKNAFSVKEKNLTNIFGKNILLIDDVFTTGATVNECAKILKKHGAKTVHVITVARA